MALLTLVVMATPALADDTVTISGDDPGPIGIDACLTQLENEFTLRATVEFDAVVDERTPTFRLYYFAGEAACYRENGIDTCPKRSTDDDGALCGCLYETNTLAINEFSTTTTLQAILADDANGVCGDNAPSEIKFVAESYYAAAADLSAESFASDNLVAVTIDRDRPPAPADAPRVQGVEGGVLVSGDGIAEGDVDYEVCVRQVGSTSTPVDGTTTNETLREGFTQCRAAGGSLSLYRFTGLEDGVNYEVVYAATDAAGNRGPNSVSATGVPQAQLDFAEQYTASLGGQAGESGGCHAAPGRSPVRLGWLALGLLALIRRRRS